MQALNIKLTVILALGISAVNSTGCGGWGTASTPRSATLHAIYESARERKPVKLSMSNRLDAFRGTPPSEQN